ncbi:MAG: yfcH: family protein [Thermoleophilia bacterium]|nr:yfcH: family protein [Thermoleophilia bacterium]
MRVLVSGAGGLIGSAVVNELRARGDEVGVLRRGNSPLGPLDVRWDPAHGTIDAGALAAGNFDAVAHFAGEPLLGRWTDTKRESIRSSRIEGTMVLARTLAQLERQPEVFVVASAVGYYGNRGDELLTESSAQGEGFLADVVSAWEHAAEAARDAGIRTVHMRMAAVYTPRGGALKAQLLPARLGLNGRFGSGRQWMSWVGLREIVRMWLFAIDDERVVGPVNAVGPTPARNQDFVRALGRVLHRPAVLPAPVPLMKLALGSQLIDEMLLASQKTVPARLEGLGYDFLDRTIDDALRTEFESD